jgi:hypothetical protein
MPITEPVTMLTDYAIAAEACLFGLALIRIGRQTAIFLWAATFGCVAIAAFLGGTCHGWVTLLGNQTVALLWRLMLYALSGASSFMLLATIQHTLPRRGQRWGWGLVGLRLLIYLGWTMAHYLPQVAFIYGVVDYLSAMLMVLILELRVVNHPYHAEARWIIAGVLVSIVAIALQGSGLTLAKHFNHNDLYHVVQMIALYLFYRGACLLKPPNEPGFL